jgi:hypothetical protein
MRTGCRDDADHEQSTQHAKHQDQGRPTEDWRSCGQSRVDRNLSKCTLECRMLKLVNMISNPSILRRMLFDRP